MSRDPSLACDARRAAVLRPVRALISDLDGTLLAGSNPQPGLVPFLGLLRKLGIDITVVTNNSARTPREFSEKLAAAGARVPPEEVVTSAQAAAAYLRDQLEAGSPVFVVGESGLSTALAEAGFALVEDSSRAAAAVVVGGDRTITHEKLKHAIRHVRAGARFIGTNPDRLVPVEDGFAPEAGVLLAAIAAGTGVQPVVIGKPERPVLEQALKRMRAGPATTAILGDRLETDILGGKRLGLIAILVTTGIDDEAAVAAKGIAPDLVVSGLEELAHLWEIASQEQIEYD